MEYINEEKYQNNLNKISKIGKLIFSILLIAGIVLISIGVYNIIKYNDKNKLQIEENKVIKIKERIEEKIKPTKEEIKKLERMPFEGFNDEYYKRIDKIEELENSISNDTYNLKVIDDALDKSFNHCAFDEAKNNIYTSEYCKYRHISTIKYMIFIMPGIFCLFTSIMIASFLFSILKRREILGFMTQQVMPIAKEGTSKLGKHIKDELNKW